MNCFFCMLVQIYESLDFFEFWHGAVNIYEMPDRAGYFGENFSAQLGKWAKNNPKLSFFWIEKKIGS